MDEKVKKGDLPVSSQKGGTVQRGDFVELKYTGYSNGEVFDSNVEEDLKKLDPEAKVKKSIIIIGKGMVVPGLDRDLEGREVGKDCEVVVKPKDGFGERRRELIKVIPLKAFTEKKVNPQPGMTLALDYNIVKIIAISGARVTTDFNNLLAGRELTYKYRIVRKVEDISEKTKGLFEGLFGFVPEFSVERDRVIMKGPKAMEEFVKSFKDKFKKLMKLDLAFEEVKEGPKEKGDEEKEKNDDENNK